LPKIDGTYLNLTFWTSEISSCHSIWLIFKAIDPKSRFSSATQGKIDSLSQMAMTHEWLQRTNQVSFSYFNCMQKKLYAPSSVVVSALVHPWINEGMEAGWISDSKSSQLGHRKMI